MPDHHRVRLWHTLYAQAIKTRLEYSNFAVGGEVINRKMNELDLIIITCSTHGDGFAPSTASTSLERLADPDTIIQSLDEFLVTYSRVEPRQHV